MDQRVVLDLHGTRALAGVEIDALEAFLRGLRTALREYDRSRRGTIARRGGGLDARDLAATEFRLVDFRVGSGIATLEPLGPQAADMALADVGDDLSIINLGALLEAIDRDERLPVPVVEALDGARRSIGDDASFGVRVEGSRLERARVEIDQTRMQRLKGPVKEEGESAVTVAGQLHRIEVDQPGRHVGIRAQNGVDWTCTYGDELHELVTTLIERLVRVEGVGRKVTALTGRLRIDRLTSVPEHTQEPLFSVKPVPIERLREEQGISAPQRLESLVDQEWEDDEASRRFLEATLGIVD